MYSTPRRPDLARAAGMALAAALLVPTLLVVAPAAHADDRDLLRESSGDPYLFIILDTSGSMHWSPPCSQAQFNAGDCNFLCPEGDCFTPLNGDDPASKFYQAKEALYEVLRDVDGVSLGFATYNQDNLRLTGKHWLYKLAAGQTGITIPSSTQVYPVASSTQVFGRPWTCTGGDTIGHDPANPAVFSDAWAIERTHRCPQLDQTGSASSGTGQFIYIKHPNSGSGTTYRFQFRNKLLQVLGTNSFIVTLRLERCTNAACGTRVLVQDKDLTYTLVSDFNSWDNAVDRANPQLGYFPQGNASDSPADNTCNGWDPNTDATSDRESTSLYNIRWPTVNHPVTAYRPTMNSGDIISLDWNDDHQDEILERLAPNRVLGETTPDFRTARYFQNSPLAGVMRLKNEPARPIVAFGSTPLGNSLANFKTYWTAFKTLGGAHDPDWACRKKYVLVLTDGDDTCPPTNPCTVAGQLFSQENIKTYVVGFGLNDTNLNPNNKLSCMASQGGTGVPFLPQNKEELVSALRSIVDQLTEEARSFASAAVPSVQAEVKDKIFLSSFTPLNSTAVWDGHVDAFLKPIPLTVDGKPDESVECSTSVTGSCHLWDAGEVILTQAPDEDEVAAGNLRLGDAADERRVYYPKAKNLITKAVPNDRALFKSPTTATARQDLWDGMGLTYTLAQLALSGSPPALQADNVIKRTLVEKVGEIDNEDGTSTEVTYVLGDIFHANPTLVDRPNDFSEFASNRYHDDSDANGESCSASSPGYRCYSRKHEFRRKMLAVGANDGLLHFFDAGIWDESAQEFDNGTGKELFAFMPRSVLPIVKETAEEDRQIFSVDGSPRVIDVFIDPEHTAGDAIDPADRRWRTVAIGGLREGGSKIGGNVVNLDNGKPFVSGYYALDVTQPDRLGGDNKPVNRDVVPSCLSNFSTSTCGPIPFGAELWEFTDSLDGSPAEWGVSFDEDDNNAPDLGDTWSQPVIVRIKLSDGSGGLEDRFVAIFGGGFDPENRVAPKSGNWLYMVDVETGEPLYKRLLEGAAASSPAVIDSNEDGYADVIYIGTTAGYMYKVNISVPQELETASVRDLNNAMHSVERVTSVEWEPFKIFDTLAGGVRRPIFFQPTVVLAAETGQLVLVFGTGDREQMWDLNGAEGRMYFIADEGFSRTAPAGTLPKLETAYKLVDSEAATNDGQNFLVRPPVDKARGFVVTLDPNERLVAPAFSVSGLTIFPTFKPQIVTDADAVCARTGDSRVFSIFTTNGDPIMPPEDGAASAARYMNIGDALVTPPYVDQGATTNPGGEPNPNDDPEWRDAIIDKLKELFPPRTRFANYTIEVHFLRSDTGHVRSIPIPIGIVEKNWKEF